jgi:hypothetical protein
MRLNTQGALPLVAILVIVVILLLFGGIILAYLTMKMWLTLLLVGVGLYLLVKPQPLSGLPATAKWLIPVVLIVLGILVYAGAVELF